MINLLSMLLSAFKQKDANISMWLNKLLFLFSQIKEQMKIKNASSPNTVNKQNMWMRSHRCFRVYFSLWAEHIKVDVLLLSCRLSETV